MSYLQCFFKTLHKNNVFVFRPEITCAVRDAHSKDHRTGFNKKNSEMSSFFSSLACPICNVFSKHCTKTMFLFSGRKRSRSRCSLKGPLQLVYDGNGDKVFDVLIDALIDYRENDVGNGFKLKKKQREVVEWNNKRRTK